MDEDYMLNDIDTNMDEGIHDDEDHDDDEDSHDDETHGDEDNTNVGMKRKRRGPSRGIKSKKVQEPKFLEWDENLEATGKWADDYSTDLGVLVRTHCNINLIWNEVDKTTKDMMWKTIQDKYHISCELESKVISHMSKLFRGWKTTLVRGWISKRRKRPKDGKMPYEVYEGLISKQDWEKFVKSHTTPEAKAHREKQRENALKNKHPHFMGRKSYRAKKKEWEKEGLIKAPEIDLSGTSDINCINSFKSVERMTMWKLARTKMVDGERVIPCEATREVEQKLLIHSKVEANNRNEIEIRSNAKTNKRKENATSNKRKENEIHSNAEPNHIKENEIHSNATLNKRKENEIQFNVAANKRKEIEAVRIINPNKGKEKALDSKHVRTEGSHIEINLEETIVQKLGNKCRHLYDCIISLPLDSFPFAIDLDSEVFRYDGKYQTFLSQDEIVRFMKGDRLDISIIHTYLMCLAEKVKVKKQEHFGFMCPDRCSETSVRLDATTAHQYITDSLVKLWNKRYVFLPYHQGEHWVLLVLSPSVGKVMVFDPIGQRTNEINIRPDLRVSFQAAFAKFGKKLNSLKLMHMDCPIQPGMKECGYYVMRYMYDIVEMFGSSTTLETAFAFNKSYPMNAITEVIEELAKFVMDTCLS